MAKMADPLTVASLVEKHEKNHDNPEKKSTSLEPPLLKIPQGTIAISTTLDPLNQKTTTLEGTPTIYTTTESA